MAFGNTELMEMDLGDSLDLPTAHEGKFSEIVREVVPLNKEDLQALELVGPSRSQSGIQHLRAFHHQVALRLAAGEKPVEICAVLSITPQTITKLSKDAQFQELIEAYREKLVEKTVDHFELMSMVGAECLMAMHERLLDDEGRQLIGFETLRKTSESMEDRLGRSPIRRSETLSRVQHDISDETMRRIKSLHAEDTAYEAQIVESSGEETKSLPEGSGTVLSISGAFEPVAEGETDGEQGSGESSGAEAGAAPEEGAGEEI